MADLDKMPPDWKFARNHAKAVRPGIVKSLLLKKGNHTFCKCCLKPIEKEQVSLCSNSKQLQFLGFGFPLYFIFVKYCIILILIFICSYSAVSLYWAVSSNEAFCQHRRLGSSAQGNPHCTSFMISLSRIQKVLSGQQIILRISSFIIHILALIYIRDNIRKTIQYYDQKSTALSDFSLILRNLPMKEGIQRNIKDFINIHFSQNWDQLQRKFTSNHFIKESQKVMQITLLPDITEYYKLAEEKDILIEQKRKIYIKQSKLDSSDSTLKYQLQNDIHKSLQSSNQEIRLKKQQIQKVKQKYRRLALEDKLPAQMAIVTLNTEMFKKTIKKYSKKNPLTKEIVGQYFGDFQGQITIQRAHEPSQIKWQNINYSYRSRFLGKVLSWALTFIFIAIATVVFYFILVSKTQNLLDAIQHSTTQEGLHNKSQYNFAVFLVFFLLILIVLFNKLIMGWALHHFTDLERHQHTSDEEFSFALKYTLGLFFTTALMTLAVEAITYHNFFAHEYGVIEEQSIMFFINALFVPFIWFLNPWQLFNLILRKFKKNKKYYTQKQANKIMSDTPYIMGKRIAQVIQTMWFTYMYATIIPLGAFITCAGLGFYYWVDKYNLLRKSSLSHNISGQMTFFSLKLLDFTLILRPIGQMIFDSQIRDGVNACSIVFICVAFVYLVLPLNQILQFFHYQQFKHQQKSYQEVKDYFLETYHTMHPILSFKAVRIFEKLQSKLSNKNVSLTEIRYQELESPMIPSTKILNQAQNSISQFQGITNKDIQYQRVTRRDIQYQGTASKDVFYKSTTSLMKRQSDQKQNQPWTLKLIDQTEQINVKNPSNQMKIYNIN